MTATEVIRKPWRKAVRQTDFTWRYLANGRTAVRYLISGDRPSGIPANVASDLKRNGIAAIPASKLLAGSPILEELVTAVEKLEVSRAGEIQKARDTLDLPGAKVQKPFVVPLLTPEQILDTRQVFVRFALADAIRQIVNNYFGMYVRLTHTNVWHTIVTQQPASQSQLWHRDPEDRHILKLFLYMRDVDEGSGPFTYAAGSHKNPYEVAPHVRLDGGTPRSTDDEMEKLVPRDRWVTATVPKGTLVFADTRGYHKGGLARCRDRIAYVAEYLPKYPTGLSTR